MQASNTAVQYPCKHCGKFKGDHQAVTLHCQNQGQRGGFRSFNTHYIYEADARKPRFLGFQI